MTIAVAPSAARSARGNDAIRVMVVDDAVVVRGLLTRWIEAEPGLALVAALRGGREAIVPDTDGITALPRLLERRGDLVVIMASTLTRRNAEISLRALALGAADYIPKPETTREISNSTSFRRELIDKIRVLGARRRRMVAPARGLSAATPATSPARRGARAGDAELRQFAGSELAPAPPVIRLRPFSSTSPRVVLIAASTGGPQALNLLVGRLNGVVDDAPVLVVQHIPPTFTTILAKHLSRASGRVAREAVDGEPVRSGRIYIAPGGRHMRVVRHDGTAAIALDDGPLVNFCKPSVDPLFSAAAQVWGARNLAVVLTGMGSDGSHGAAEIVAAGGSVIAQDEATSVVWGMPGAVALAGLCSAVLPLEQIAPRVIRMFAGGRS